MTKETLWGKLRELWTIRKRCRALAAGRQHREQAETHAKFCSKMANERLEETVTLKQQLLSAQAEIEKQHEFIKRCGDHMIAGSNIADTPIPTEQEWRDILKEPDLSDLREHNAEVRRPLVEALKYAVAKLPYATAMVAEICRNALAKVKEEAK